MQEEEKDWSLVRLKWAVQALALPANEQRGLFPSFVLVGDELALDFYECRETALKDHALTDDQLSALESLDTTLSHMTAENNMELWDEPGVDHPRWGEVRETAKDALKRLGWNLDTPPKDRAIYVGPPSR
jgi:hypothetical protein